MVNPMKKYQFFILKLIAFSGFFFLVTRLCAEPVFNADKQGGSLLLADHVVYEKELGVVTARGNVEIEHEGNVLHADVVTYNEKMDKVTATGNVRIDEQKNNIIYLDYA
jgi:lipopolysaccharide assembly outer membrane protein LptD (OstA)